MLENRLQNIKTYCVGFSPTHTFRYYNFLISTEKGKSL